MPRFYQILQASVIRMAAIGIWKERPRATVHSEWPTLTLTGDRSRWYAANKAPWKSNGTARENQRIRESSNPVTHEKLGRANRDVRTDRRDLDTSPKPLVRLPFSVYDSLITRQRRASVMSTRRNPAFVIRKESPYSSGRRSVTGRSANFHGTLFLPLLPSASPLRLAMHFARAFLMGTASRFFLPACRLMAKKFRRFTGSYRN